MLLIQFLEILDAGLSKLGVNPAASNCIFSIVSSSTKEHTSHTSNAYSKIGQIKDIFVFQCLSV